MRIPRALPSCSRGQARHRTRNAPYLRLGLEMSKIMVNGTIFTKSPVKREEGRGMYRISLRGKNTARGGIVYTYGLEKSCLCAVRLFAWGDHLSLDPHTGEYVIFTLSLASWILSTLIAPFTALCVWTFPTCVFLYVWILSTLMIPHVAFIFQVGCSFPNSCTPRSVLLASPHFTWIIPLCLYSLSFFAFFASDD